MRIEKIRKTLMNNNVMAYGGVVWPDLKTE